MLTFLLAAAPAFQATAPEEIERGPIIRGETGDHLEEYLERLAGFGFSGVVLVALGDEVVLARGYGLADRAAGVPVDTRTVISTGSITKQFTAAAILLLEERGELRVEDPLAKHLPGVPEERAAITLHHLLTHSSGLRSDFADGDFDPVGREEYARRALNSELEFEPGTGFGYANSGYSLLAAVIERASGRSYEAFMREEVFLPLGMRDTGYKLPAWDAERLAHGYTDEGDWGTIVGRPMAADGPYWALRGNGGIHTTLADVWRWHRALVGDELLSEASRSKLFHPHVSEGGSGRFSYGYGWSVTTTVRGKRLVTHNGSNGIFFADLRRYLDEDVLIYAASNARPHAGEISQNLARIVFEGSLPELPPELVALDGEVLAALAGTYVLDGGEEIRVRAADGALELEGGGPRGFALLMHGPGLPAPRLTACTDRTREVIEAAAKGDFRPLQAAFGGELTLARIERMEGELWAQWKEALGGFRGLDVLGSAPGPMGITSFTRLDFERGTRYLRYAWEGGTLVGVRPTGEGPAKRLLPESRESFVAYDAREGTTFRVEFRAEPDGSVTLLVGGEAARRL